MSSNEIQTAVADSLHAQIVTDDEPLICYDDGSEVTRVFRFFRDPLHADALASGSVWITTLSKCRADESASGDQEEAYEHYNSGVMRIDCATPDDPRVARLSRMAGITLGPGVSANITNMTTLSKMNDGYVICTTRRYEPTAMEKAFGEHCVEIRNPIRFFAEVTRQLALERQIGGAAIGCIRYASRTVVGMEPIPGVRGFVKPVDPYEVEQEVRMLWARGSMDPIAPFLLHVPAAAEFCRRIS